MEDLYSAEVWPCCWAAVSLMAAVSGQWRIGAAGAIGLDYNVLPFVMEMRGIPRPDWPQVFTDLTVMERAVLDLRAKESSG